ncbi:LamG domain-containing protein [Acidobacteria bacterium AH-259-A15]|nr:LamG domain-containing protein [Acidobacteria bacterium AH-259-A15]
MMNQVRLVLSLFLATSLIAGVLEEKKSGSSQNVRITFDDVEVGKLPADWKVEATHAKGKLADWSVQKDATASPDDQVLLLKINDHDRGTFNLCWTDQVSFQDGIVEVKVKAREGRIDQGGGPIWRVKDKDNYYIARWNPLEDNFRIYYVKDGKRVQLDTAKVKLPADQWHTISVHHQGNQITGYINGKKLLEVNDTTFPEAGGVGVWTKADAASSFDDLEIQAR